MSEMLKRDRLLRDSARKAVPWRNSLLECVVSIKNLDLGLDSSLVDLFGDHPQLLGDLAVKGALHQGDLTCCAASGRCVWAPICIDDSRNSIFTGPPQVPATLRAGQFWQVCLDSGRGGMV